VSLAIAVLTLIPLSFVPSLFARTIFLFLRIHNCSARITTVVQNSFAFITLFSGELMTLTRIFQPTSHEFWRVSLNNSFVQASFVSTIGAAFNISLLWIEVANNGGICLMNNIRKTRLFLISVIALLYIWLLFFVIFSASRMTQIVDIFSMVLLGISFFLGSKHITKLLLSGIEENAETTEEVHREQAQRAEIIRILKNARAICFFCLIFIVAMAVHLYSSIRRTVWLGFLGYQGAKLALLCIQVAVLSHLNGVSVCLCSIKWVCFKNRRTMFLQAKNERKVFANA